MKYKIALIAAFAYLAGEYVATVRAQGKTRQTIDYYEQELMKKTLYADALQWAADNATTLSKEELVKGVRERLLFMRIVTSK